MEKSSEDFKNLIAFLVKIEKGSLMDKTPESILAEVEKVDQPGYIDSLDEVEKKRYNAYIEFHKINQRKDTKMSDEQEKVEGGEQAAAPASEAPASEGSGEQAA